MIGKRSAGYHSFVDGHRVPGKPHIPRSLLGLPRQEVERRLEEGRSAAPALGDHVAYTRSLCRGRAHRAYYIDDPDAKGRAFFCTTWGDPLLPTDIEFTGASPTILLFYSAPCLQASFHVHTLVVVDTPVLLKSLQDGRGWSVVGTAASRTCWYIEDQAEAEGNFFAPRGVSSLYLDADVERPETRLVYDGGTLAPLPRRVRDRIEGLQGRATAVQIHSGVDDLGYPWSSVYESGERGMGSYAGEPAVTIPPQHLDELLAAIAAPGAAAVLGNLRDVFVTDLTYMPRRDELLPQEESRLRRLDDTNGSHDEEREADADDIF